MHITISKPFMKLCIAALCAAGVTGCGVGGSGGGAALEGTYLPQFPPGTMRFERSMTDTHWEFTAEGGATTHSTAAGARRWTYTTGGGKVQLTGIPGEHTAGERRQLTFGDNGCIWDGSGKSSVDVLFCPAADN